MYDGVVTGADLAELVVIGDLGWVDFPPELVSSRGWRAVHYLICSAVARGGPAE